MNTSASNSHSASDSRISDDSDPVLAALKDARDRRDQADRDIRILLAYARELARPRPYRLTDLAAAAGMSISGVRSAYTCQHTETAQRLLRAVGDGQSTSRTTERTPDNAR
jgi:AraC-like DNA-binding protein